MSMWNAFPPLRPVRVGLLVLTVALVVNSCTWDTDSGSDRQAPIMSEANLGPGVQSGDESDELDGLIREGLSSAQELAQTNSREIDSAEPRGWRMNAEDFVAGFLVALGEHDYELASEFVNNGDTFYLPGIDGESNGIQWGMPLLLSRYCQKAMCGVPFEVLGSEGTYLGEADVRVRFTGWGEPVEALIKVGWWEGVPSVISLPPEKPVRSSAMSLVWTVIGVGLGDVLNVRAEPNPNATVIGQLAPWSSQFAATTTVEENSQGRWRLVDLPNGERGWVNTRFLVAQPLKLDEQSKARMVESVDSLVAWVLGGSGEPLLSEGALWVGGIGVFADATPWTWIPASSLGQRSGWEVERTFDVGLDDCGSHCIRSLRQFLRFDLLGPDTTTLVDDIVRTGMSDGVMWFAPDELHRVVIDKRADGDTYDWQRIHFVFDWSSGKQRLALIHTHGWTS